MDLKQWMGVIFGVSCLDFLYVFARTFPAAARQPYQSPFLDRVLGLPELSIAVAVVCGVAAWTILTRRQSSGTWAIAASLAHLLLFFRTFILHLRPVSILGYRPASLLVAIFGLVVFLRPGAPDSSP